MEIDFRVQTESDPSGRWVRLTIDEFGERHWESLGGLHWFLIEDSGLRVEPQFNSVWYDYRPIEAKTTEFL